MKINIDIRDLFGEVAQLRLESEIDKLGLEIDTQGKQVIVKKGNHLGIYTKAENIEIHIQKQVEIYRALSFLKEEQVPLLLEQKPCFDTLGYMIDVSRNAVLTVTAIKDLLFKMAVMGFNMCMMYTEDVYEIENEPFFGYMRGRYTKEELKSIDDYAYELGIELVPCIQTLGHLENALKWGDLAKYKDTSSVLLAGDEAVYDLIERMIASTSDVYRSRRIHLGMDEAMDLGLGRYLQKHGYTNGFEIIKGHLDRVEEIVKRYGLRPMIWSDMYFRLGSEEHFYYDEACSIPQEVIDHASEDIELVYWDYYHKTHSFYNDYIEKHKQFKANTIFAGGMWTWVGAAVNYPLFFKTSIPALESCVTKGIKEVLLTAWGDNGAEANIQGFLPALQVYAEFCYNGEFNLDCVKERFKQCIGEDIEPFLEIGQFDALPMLEHLVNDVPNPSKFLFYQDPLVGLFDEDVKDLERKSHYEKLAKVFENHSKASKQYSLLFRFYSEMARFLSYKAELGIDILNAYKQENEEKLASIVTVDLELAIQYLNQLRSTWRELWFTTNKAFGYEVIDIRLGGLLARLESTQLRLNQYIHRQIDSIEELEVERLSILRGKNVSGLEGAYVWANIVTANKI